MSTKLIKTKDYLLLIDLEAEIKEGSIITNGVEVFTINSMSEYSDEYAKRYWENIIAYYPLTKEAKELDLPLLPVTPRNEWGVHEKHCCSKHGCKYGNNNCCVELGITKQRYPCEDCNDEDQKFSLEDMYRVAIKVANKVSRPEYGEIININEIVDTYIQSLSTQQLPISFEPEYEAVVSSKWGYGASCNYKLKIITNSEGKQVLMGNYKY